MKKTIKYYLLIGISVFDIVISVLGILLFTLYKTQAKIQLGFDSYIIIPKSIGFISVILAIICIISFSFLTALRQKARDDMEYDEFGINKKNGKFSQLSADKRKEIEFERLKDQEMLLGSGILRKITKEGSKNPTEEMNKMIGLKEVKNQMNAMVARMEFEKEQWKNQYGKKKFIPNESMHMIFIGEPGTGKTTVARIMTGFLYQNGYIKKNQCIEVDGNFFRSSTAGDSSKKTRMLVQKSLGGVLFIDEAYSLMNNIGGQEVIATIVKEMEDNRNNIIIIFAGYNNEMKQLINTNPGIESRIKHYLYFDGYTMADYQHILLNLAHDKNLTVSEEYLRKFVEKMKIEKTKRNFGNARTVRNIFEKTIDKHAVNLKNGTLKAEDKFKLKVCDIEGI